MNKPNDPVISLGEHSGVSTDTLMVTGPHLNILNQIKANINPKASKTNDASPTPLSVGGMGMGTSPSSSSEEQDAEQLEDKIKQNLNPSTKNITVPK